ncbi:MAG: hypothetical protein JJU00_13485 [Opitutales bacterium]|nr:hypothetical protein [Opitutales bacterium]
MLENEYDEAKWPDLTCFRKACLASDFTTMRSVSEKKHSWYKNENPDNLPMDVLATVAKAQHYAGKNEKEALSRLVESEPWVLNHPWTAQRWLPISQAAASHGDKEMIELMLELGADPCGVVGSIGEEGSIPDMARWGGHEDLAEWLDGVIAAKQTENKARVGQRRVVAPPKRTSQVPCLPGDVLQKDRKFLSADAFKRSALFLKSKARPLEISRFERIFEGSPIVDVLIELKKFQNGDGGFGHALEPDVRVSESSALCTSIAFQIIRFHDVPASESLVLQGLRYFAITLDRSTLHWRIIPETAGITPHAPWWNQAGREAEFEVFSLNPTAEILGYVLDYGDSVVDKGVISQIMDCVIEKLKSLKAIEMHDLLCCLRLLEAKNLSPTARERIRGELKRLASGAVAKDPEPWKGYSLRPLQIISNPDSPFMHGLEEAVSLNLDYEIAEQEDDGTWSPTWSWGDQYPEVWPEAKSEWTGILTLDKLVTLMRFNRIESSV